MGMEEVIVAIVVIGLPILFLMTWTRGHFRLKERQLEAETLMAAEKAAQYAASNAQLEARVRVLEQIVTDQGAQTATQIEALRNQKSLTGGDKVQ